MTKLFACFQWNFTILLFECYTLTVPNIIQIEREQKFHDIALDPLQFRSVLVCSWKSSTCSRIDDIVSKIKSESESAWHATKRCSVFITCRNQMIQTQLGAIWCPLLNSCSLKTGKKKAQCGVVLFFFITISLQKKIAYFLCLIHALFPWRDIGKKWEK